MASKFWEHFIYIANAMSHRGDDGMGLWNEEDGFFYDVLHAARRAALPHEGPLDGRTDSRCSRWRRWSPTCSTACRHSSGAWSGSSKTVQT